MKKMIKRILWIFFLTVLILVSWRLLLKVSGRYPSVKRFEEECLSKWDSFLEYIGFKEKKEDKSLEMRAVWLSYLEMEEFAYSSDGSEKDFRQFASRMVRHSKELGLNCIIFQVRPFGDALYDSDIFPWSAFISSGQGKDPGYDPLEIMVDVCHEKNMKIEAWVNPYRIGTDSMDLSEDNPALSWIREKNRNVLHYDGMYYYNPSSQEVRELIAAGIKEIVSRYDVDGIHLDDYFYPELDKDRYDQVFDASEYKAGLKSGEISESTTIADWRRDNVDALVRLLYKTVKDEDPSLSFGISPNGNPEELNSDTAYYVNLDHWLGEEGYIDYIMPQIYWGYKNPYAPFQETLDWWEARADDTHVDLYIGLQVYRMGVREVETAAVSPEEEEMQDPDLLRKQIKSIDQAMNVSGFCIFSYRYLDPDFPPFFQEEDKDNSDRIRILKEVEESLRSITW